MPATQAERDAMQHALVLAQNGPRGVNPQVGAVILSPDGEVLAEGWHRGAGTSHAEIDALSKLAPGEARGATAVVTLEPCNHHGRTGPCSEALIAAGVARVVYAIADPGRALGRRRRSPSRGGRGCRIRPPRRRGDGPARRPGSTVQRLDRPHVTVKWAQSLDGRAAASDGTSQWITGPEARADVHRRRAEADAIVAGTGTVLADDPALTARTADGSLFEHQPIPVVIGETPTPDAAAVRSHPRGALFYADARHRRRARRPAGSAASSASSSRADPTLASAFVRAGLADEVLAYVAPVLLGGDRLALTDIGVSTIDDARRLTVASIERLGDDLLIVARPVRHAQGTHPAPHLPTHQGVS